MKRGATHPSRRSGHRPNSHSVGTQTRPDFPAAFGCPFSAGIAAFWGRPFSPALGFGGRPGRWGLCPERREGGREKRATLWAPVIMPGRTPQHPLLHRRQGERRPLPPIHISFPLIFVSIPIRHNAIKIQKKAEPAKSPPCFPPPLPPRFPASLASLLPLASLPPLASLRRTVANALPRQPDLRAIGLKAQAKERMRRKEEKEGMEGAGSAAQPFPDAQRGCKGVSGRKPRTGGFPTGR